MIRREIGIALGPDMLVMVEMLGAKPVHPEAGVKQQGQPPEEQVHCRAAGSEAAVHRVMRDDEQPDAEPAQHRHQRHRERPGPAA